MELTRCEDVRRIFHNKFVIVIGGSIQRSMYKDIVLLLQEDRLLQERELRSKGEHEFMGDKLIEGGQTGKMTNGKNYREVRQYQTDVHLVRFYFVTRCYNKYMETVLADLTEEPTPDVVIMTSCLWDISRYGPYSMPEFHKNLQRFFHHLSKILPKDTLFIWNTTLPISAYIKGGFLLDYISFMQETLRRDVVEANYFAAQVATDYGHDVLDLHYNFRHLQHHRVKDGVHWNATAHRYISQLLLHHIARAWHIPIPRKGTFKHPNDPRKEQCTVQGRVAPTFPPRPRRNRSISCCPAFLDNETPIFGGNTKDLQHQPHRGLSQNNVQPSTKNMPPSRCLPSVIASDRGFWMDEPNLGFNEGGFLEEQTVKFIGQLQEILQDNRFATTLVESFNKMIDHNCNFGSDNWGGAPRNPVFDRGYDNPGGPHENQLRMNNNYRGFGNNHQDNSGFRNQHWPSSRIPHDENNMYGGMGQQYHARNPGRMRQRRGRPFHPYPTNPRKQYCPRW